MATKVEQKQADTIIAMATEITTLRTENETLKAKVEFVRKRYPEIDEMEKILKEIDIMKYKGRDYAVRDSNCKKCKSFLPYSGNGRNICRLYELGKCPKALKGAK